MKEKNIQEDISQLQGIEQNLRGIEMQKQNMQMQLLESENSIKELKDYSGKPFRIIGPVMIESNKDELVKDLGDKIELLKIRLESMEKQEKSFRQQFEDIQAKLIASMNHSQKNN
ncbi:MAG: prefoldin subunit beta [Nanoarchaeota archaeon]|nr:prefoldin subunit beta [Nanoarchaeota archaeon]